ncbi:unnamed protein product [Darwinula stevensoni]|uniref:Spaetzle domain-containing protein n=1 Tax=Darwinula stevensoni TaxID=69355 RepID=A0A7R8XAD3_9CRUS|nr:unnamed protein product [Darwinula stevensoni]CAG0885346.1 unnamed protein product [Darwinula stevensoni]
MPHEHRQMYCRDGCRCEQQYRLHRLLAFDPSNDCRGIFSDWFKFPSCCICKCYNVPLRSLMAGERKPRVYIPGNDVLEPDDIDPEPRDFGAAPDEQDDYGPTLDGNGDINHIQVEDADIAAIADENQNIGDPIVGPAYDLQPILGLADVRWSRNLYPSTANGNGKGKPLPLIRTPRQTP